MLIPLETAAGLLSPPSSLSQYCLSHALVCNIWRLRVVVVFLHKHTFSRSTSENLWLGPTRRQQLLEDAGFRMQSVGLVMQIRGGLLCRGDLESSCGKTEHVFFKICIISALSAFPNRLSFHMYS